MNDGAEKSSARSAVILVVIIVIVAIYGITFGFQTLQWIDAHHWASANPWLNEVPQPIAAQAAPTAAAAPAETSAAEPAKRSKQPKDTLLTAYNYEFTVPWTGKNKEVASPGGAEFRFDSGQVVVFGDPDAQLDTLRLLRDSASPEYAPFQNAISSAGISSNYQLYKAVYGTSPAQTSPWMAFTSAQQNRVLLLTKLSFGFDLERKIYSFDFGNNKGFQFGDPGKGPVAVRVFNARDKQFRFLFTVAAGSGGQITQDDINEAIQSLQPEPFETR